MTLCENCKFAKPVEQTGLFQCERWLVGYGYSAHDIGPSDCLVENDEDWGMLLGPKFGCVLGEPAAPITRD